jgi:SAM-dependent methyltransferase
MSEVLEHIPDPAAFCLTAGRLLKPGGLLCVAVPNEFSPFQQALQAGCNFSPWWLQPPHHINFFNFDSLENLLARCGFTVIHREATFPIDMFLLMGDNYVGDDQLGRLCHRKRMQFELNLDRGGMQKVRRELYQAFAHARVGREIIMYATTADK